MTTQHKHDFKPCVAGAFGGGLSRALFFDGMVLSETDLLREQGYWRMKRKLTNRALGEGVVWGLTTEWNAKARTFTVCPGYGLSCCGDDLVVECPETVGEGQLIDPCSEEFRALLHDKFDTCDECARPDEPVPAALMLEYVECPEDPRSTYEDPCAETARGCRYGAVRETVRLRLVPPPQDCAGPLDRFCRKIRELREELAEAQIDMPEPDFNPFKPESRFGVAVQATADGTVAGGSSARVELKDGSFAETSPTPLSANQQARVFLDPPDGHMFTKAEVDGVDRSGAPTMLGWSQDLSGPLPANRTIVAETAPLFGPGPGLRVTYVVNTTVANAGVQVRVTVQAVAELGVRADCASLIGGNPLQNGDALCRIKAMALALVYGVASGRIASAACGAEDLTEDEANARKTIAWALCWIAWKALYGIDTSEPKAAKIQTCLRALFVEWCEGFAYKGPRCCATSHGIYLGGVELSPRGRILCFDPWRYRRHVLTGPLLTHWTGQFGLPPIDRVAARVASWICCVARADVGTAPAVLDQASGMLMPLGTGSLAIGPAFAAGNIGGAATRRSSEDPIEFALSVLNAYFDRGRSASSAPSVEVTSVENAPVHLVTPDRAMAAAPAAAPASEWSARSAIAADTPPIAHKVGSEFLGRFAETVPVASLKPEAEIATFEPVLAALEKAEIRSIAALAALGPEKAADRVREELVGSAEFADAAAVDKATGIVYERAVRLLESAGEAIASEARSREPGEPFIRSDLPDVVSDVQRAANQFLKKGKGTTLAGLREVAARTVAARG